MTNEELALAIQAGENRYAELWGQTRGFIYKQAFSYSRYFPDSILEIDDLTQGGYLALVDAVEAYDPNRGKFLTLLGFHLLKTWRQMYGLRGRMEYLDTALSLDEPIDDGDRTRLDLIPDERREMEETDEALFRGQLRATLEKALDAAPHGDVVRRRYFQDQKAKEIASELGISVSRVSQREKECKNYLRRHSRELREFAEGFDFYHGTGLQSWRDTGETIQEKYLIRKDRIDPIRREKQ